MSLVLTGSTSGSCTLQEQAVAGTTTLTLPTFSGTVGLLVSGTAVASTSGTSIDFTSIPAGVRRITVMFSGVSTNGTSPIVARIGAGSVETSGYAATNAAIISTTCYCTTFTASFGLTADTSVMSSANLLQGSVTLTYLSANIWVISGVVGTSSQSIQYYVSGSKSLSGVLDRIRITTVNGTDTFDAGSINILYE